MAAQEIREHVQGPDCWCSPTVTAVGIAHYGKVGGFDVLDAGRHADIPGWEGSQGPFPGQYGQPHVYARDIHSGAGNCVCGHGLGEWVHVQAAPGIPIPDSQRQGPKRGAY